MEEENECVDYEHKPVMDAFEMPGELYEELRVLSILNNSTMQEVIIEALEKHVQESFH